MPWKGTCNQLGRTRIVFVRRVGPFGGLSCLKLEQKDGKFLSKPGFLKRSSLGARERSFEVDEGDANVYMVDSSNQ